MNNAVMFGIMLTMLRKEKVTLGYLAEKFEMSKRSIARYIDELAMSGVPIYATYGKDGGYSIASEYQFDKVFFTEAELDKLRATMRDLDDYDDGVNLSILTKLDYLNKRRDDEKYLLETDSLIIDAGPWNNPTLYRSKMEALQRAIDRRRTVKIIYIDRYEERTHRDFDPYYRILKEGVWYTYGWCHSRNDFRLFKLSRISSLIETEQTFTKKKCDVYKHLEGKFDDVETVDLEIEFSNTILGDVEEWLGIDSIDDGGLRYKARAIVYGGRPLINKLLGFGSAIKVLSPEFVKREIADECRRILEKG